MAHSGLDATICALSGRHHRSPLRHGGRQHRRLGVPTPGQVRRLAAERGVAVETAEAMPLPAESFELVVCQVAAHHFSDLPRAMGEMVRLTRPGGHVAVIDMEGDADPDLDAFNHEIEVLHDPTHVRPYTAKAWRELFIAH